MTAANHQTTQDKTVLLVDINSYFATMLQQENPNLRGKPVVVVKDLGRTCVIAASKEAKKYGIKTGSNVVRAKQLAPDLIEMKAEFDLYLSATRRLKKLFESIAPNMIVYSLDEAFIDISDCQRYLYPSPKELGEKIQDKIKAELGQWVTCNVGIGPNKFLAKMAAEISPKGSVFTINAQNLDPILAEVEFEDVCGIGSRLAHKLKIMNINHPYQIRFFEEQDLQPMFGPFWSKELLKMAYGQEPHHLQLLDSSDSKSSPTLTAKNDRMKSVSRSITLWELMDDEADIKRVLYNLTREVVYKVRKMRLAGRRVSASLWGSDYMSQLCWHDHITLSSYINHTQEMFELIWDKLYLNWQRQFKPIKFRVSLGLLESINKINQPLLPSWHQHEALEQALDQISHKYGLFTVRSGLLTNEKIIKPEVTGFLGDKAFQLAD